MTTLTDSILDSIKALLGLSPEIEDFDLSIMMLINSGIFSLSQMGVGPKNGYIIESSSDTFEDYLGEDFSKSQRESIKMYLYYKTRLGWDPPTSSFVLQELKNQLAEVEWRLYDQSNYSETFE